jgi:hypothetical protein
MKGQTGKRSSESSSDVGFVESLSSVDALIQLGMEDLTNELIAT